VQSKAATPPEVAALAQAHAAAAAAAASRLAGAPPPKAPGKLEEVQPSDWFRAKWQEWQKDLQSWHMKHIEYRDPSKRAKVAQQNGEEGSALGGNQRANAEAEKELEDGDELMQQLEDEILGQELDIFGLESVCDVGGGEPLFSGFAFEDWALLSLRFEVHLLVHAFKRDSTEPGRKGIQLEHLAYYYNKYYKKLLNPKSYGVGSIMDVVGLINDTIVVVSNVVESQLVGEVESNDIFVRLTEESRRLRQRRIDGGDGTAELRFFGRPAEGPAKSGPRPSARPQAPATAGGPQPQAFTKSGVPPRPMSQVVYPLGWGAGR